MDKTVTHRSEALIEFLFETLNCNLSRGEDYNKGTCRIALIALIDYLNQSQLINQKTLLSIREDLSRVR